MNQNPQLPAVLFANVRLFVCLTVVWLMFPPVDLDAGLIAVNSSDSTSNMVRRFDFNGGPVDVLIEQFGPDADGIYQSLDYDATTQKLYGLYRDPTDSQLRVISWDLAGNFVNDVGLGFGAALNRGADMTVHNGMIAVSLTDFGSSSVLRFTTSGAPMGALNEQFGTPGDGIYQSLDYDAATGNLFGLYKDPFLGELRVVTWNPGGSILADFSLSGAFVLLLFTPGADMTVHDGTLAVSLDDVTSTTVRRYTTSGAFIDVLIEQFGPDGNGIFQSLDHNPETGDLFALYHDPPSGALRVISWDTAGNFVADFGLPIAVGINSGADIAVIPEPSTLVLAGIAMLGILAFGRRRRRTG